MTGRRRSWERPSAPSAPVGVRSNWGPLVDLANLHRLGSLDAVVLLELLRCWPEDGIVEGKRVRLPVGSLLGTGASRDGIMLATRRLQRRDLVSLEIAGGRVHYRLWHDVVGVLPEPGGAINFRSGLIEALSPCVSRGRDVVVLLNLLATVQRDQTIARITVRDLSRRVGMMPRSVYRSLARIRDAGAVVRVRRGWDLSPLISAAARRNTE